MKWPLGHACVRTVVAQQHATLRGVLAALSQRWSLCHSYRQGTYNDILRHGRRATEIAQFGFHDCSVSSTLVVRVARRVGQTIRLGRPGIAESKLARWTTETAIALDPACDILRSCRMHARVTASPDGSLKDAHASVFTPYFCFIGQGQRACRRVAACASWLLHRGVFHLTSSMILNNDSPSAAGNWV